MWLFRILFDFDALLLAVLLYFFVDGLQYGPPAEEWLFMLGIPAAVLAGAWALQANGKRGLGSILLFALATPGLLYLLFIALLLILQPNWQ
jgi:hypothetical protein